MFDILFGWRKASKCKKLIRQVQCRLKLLKNKRSSIVRQLREDVAQLLRHGHEQSAFDRVEQLFKDESTVAMYDLLDHFCEFIIINLSYIRRNKDCPNDINEAISTLIYASARCGDLPELRAIRKLFGERYGQRFAAVALELLPGNLVNHQIKESLSMKSVEKDVKYRLLDDIARTCLHPGPLALEYFPQLQEAHQTNKDSGDQVIRSGKQTNYNRSEVSQVEAYNVHEAEGKMVCMDLSDMKKLPIEKSAGSSIDRSPKTLHLNVSRHVKEERKEDNYAESSIESPSELPKEMVYLDDIEELKSPMKKEGNFQDQRLFKFKSSVIANQGYYKAGVEKDGPRSSRKSKKAVGKRQRKRSVSQEKIHVKNIDCAIYYGESQENSPNSSGRSHRRRKHQKEILADESHMPKSEQPWHVNGMIHECSLDNPCYFSVSDDPIPREENCKQQGIRAKTAPRKGQAIKRH
ncbi:hypothetical protein NMG60_11035562 [Bertholletia excelsa]